MKSLTRCDISLTREQGNWIAATPIPSQTLETRERRLKGREQELLLALVRKLLRWLPEERPSAENLFDDEFLVRITSLRPITSLIYTTREVASKRAKISCA